MSKKKRTKKKRPNARKSNKSNQESKKKAPPAELQTLGKVLTRLFVFVLVSAGLFYVTVHHIIGGVAMWKVFVLASLPLFQITTRRLSFGTPSIGGLFKPSGTKLAVCIGSFLLGNAVCFALFQFVVQGKPADATGTKLATVAMYIVSPIFAFLIKANAATWTSFASLATPMKLAAAFASLAFFYGVAVLFHLEKDHLPVERAPIEMMPV